jgi:pyrroline-5-carboxylate reductase
VVEVDETDLDAVTGLSGSGPAYVFLLAEALIDAAIAEGLEAPVATALAEQTLLGAASLLRASSRTPAELRADVTSPNGTTAAAVAVFEAADFRGLVAAAVTAATHRSRALGAS